jgi:hypothetical protein
MAARLCAAIGADELRVIEVTPRDYQGRPAHTYASLRPQAVDACIIAPAERFEAREVAVLDRRDFQASLIH